MQNLWPELNNEQESPGTAGQAQEPPRRRRLTEQVVLLSLRDWLLHDFALPYCRTLSASRIYRRCYWIDALGGKACHPEPFASLKGKLREGSGSTDAEILRCAQDDSCAQDDRCAQDDSHEGTATALHGIVLEAGSSKRKEKRHVEGEQGRNDHVASSAKAGRSPIYRGTLPQGKTGIVRASWLEIAPALLDLIGQSPAIFLLNPFGHTLFTYDDLAPLYQRTAPTELCLLIVHKQVMAHLTSAHLAPTPLAPARGATTLTALLRSDRWKTLPTSDEEVKRAIDGVIDLLIASMQRHFLSVQRIALPVQIRPAVVEIAPYTLIFATRRQDSLAKMNDAVCMYRRRLHEQSRRGVLAEEWFAAQQKEHIAEEMQQLYRRTLQQGRAQRVRRWPDLRQQLLNADFGRYTVHEYDEVMQQLLASGDVRCEWRRRPLTETGVEPESEERPIPGNEDILLWK